MEFTFVTGFWFLGACRDGRFESTCDDNCVFRNGQDVLLSRTTKVCGRIDEIGLPGFLEASSIHRGCSIVGVAGSAQVDWTGFG